VPSSPLDDAVLAASSAGRGQHAVRSNASNEVVSGLATVGRIPGVIVEMFQFQPPGIE